MYFNEQQNPLIKWFKGEITALQPEETCSDAQINSQISIRTLILKTQQLFDRDIKEQYYVDCLMSIQSYLDKQMGKKLRRSFKKALTERLSTFQACEERFSNQLEHFLSLLLFMCIHSKEKSAFINRILDLPEKTQMEVMQQIENTEKNKLQNFVKTGQMLEQICLISEENSLMEQKLADLLQVNQQLKNIQFQTLQENQKIYGAVCDNRQQKMKIMEQLKIEKVSEYLDMFQKLNAKKEKLIVIADDLDVKCSESYREVDQLKSRILADEQVISQLLEEISKCRQFFGENPGNVNSLNSTLASSLKNRNNADQFYQLRSSKRSKSYFDGDQLHLVNINNLSQSYSISQSEDEHKNLLKYNGQLMNKYQQMEKNINNLSSLKANKLSRNQQLRKKLQADNNFIKQIANLENIFFEKYQSIKYEPLKLLQNHKKINVSDLRKQKNSYQLLGNSMKKKQVNFFE